MENMTIQWWMLDGAVGLILLVAVIRGAARGIGDTFLRLVGLAGGLGLSFMYSGKVSDYLEVSPVQRILHTHMYVIIRDYLMGGSDEPVQGADVTSTDIINGFVGNVRSDPYTEAMPKTISSAVNDLADKTANAAATRLTDICISILSVLAILLAVWLVMAIIRLIYRSARKSSALIRLSDRLLGMVLGVIRGLALSFLAAAALIPATTFFAPTRVPEMLATMDQTYVAGILYDMNPVMLIVQHFFQ
jgi:uncharacterized membrane protein required for colicin V production